MKGEELAKYIFGPNEYDDEQSKLKYNTSTSGFYYKGGSNAQARKMFALQAGNPNEEPTPFRIPSACYSDPYWQNQQYGRDVVFPSYVIEGGLALGGHIDSDASKFVFKQVNTGLIFNSIIFEGGAYINCFESISYMQFTNCKFKGKFSVLNSKIQKLKFERCSFGNSSLDIRDCAIEEIVLNDCNEVTVKIDIDIEKEYKWLYQGDFLHRIDSLKFKNGFIEKLAVNGQNVSSIEIDETDHKEWEVNLKTNDLRIRSKSPKKTHFKSLIIDWINQEKDAVSIVENISVDELKLTGHLKKSSLVLSNCEMQNLSIKDFVNEGQFRIIESQVIQGGSVEFIRTQFGKAEFNTIDFSKAERFQIFSTNIADLVTHDVRFPQNIVTKSPDDYEGIRAIQRQLKNAAGKQADKVNELRHEQAEMNVLMTILSKEKSWDYWLLALNRWTSRHGQDWLRAGAILFLLGSLFFAAIRLSLGYVYFRPSLFFDNAADLLTFLNPIHRYEAIFDEKNVIDKPLLTGLAKLLDGVFRGISSYLLFQFVRASRKYFR